MILQQDKVGAKSYELAEREAIAADWFELAARSNHAGAMVRLGFLHEKGVKINRNQVLVDKSIAKAAKWYQKAADGEHNSPEAQNALGLLFYKNLITHKVLIPSFICARQGEEELKWTKLLQFGNKFIPFVLPVPGGTRYIVKHRKSILKAF